MATKKRKRKSPALTAAQNRMKRAAAKWRGMSAAYKKTHKYTAFLKRELSK